MVRDHHVLVFSWDGLAMVWSGNGLGLASAGLPTCCATVWAGYELVCLSLGLFSHGLG